MKKIYLIIIVVLFAMQLKAQFIYDKWGEIIPFSLTEKYKEVVNTDEIHSLVLPSYNNDSLFFKMNKVKSYSEIKNVFCVGFPIDSLINFQDYAKKIKIEEGTLWIMTIESATAQGIGVLINDIEIPEKAYLTIYPGTIPYLIEDPEVGFKKDIDNLIREDNGLDYCINDSKVIIEFFVPKGIIAKPNLIINRLSYDFQGLGKPGRKMDFKKLKEQGFQGASGMLKSGGLTDTTALPCQKDVVCSEVAAWTKGVKSVVNIVIPFYYNGTKYESQGTGFFVNKSGSGYTGNDKPVLVTCGHLFAPEISPGNYLDISNNHDKLRVYVDYENLNCNETNIRYGKNIIGGFSNIDRIMLGSSYLHSSTYNESEDYAILQPRKTVDKLAKYNIDYAGWTANPNYLDEGYAAIGHPVGDVKKINVENSSAWAYSDYFLLYFDIGVSEHGFSGSPVFNAKKQVVGWLCTGEGSCATVGQNNSDNYTTCGRFDNLWPYVSSIIDPTGTDTAQSSNPTPPAPSELPSHCRNCIQDDDETGIDCGGSCYPCGMSDVVTVKTAMDIPGKVKSRYDIFAEPDPNTLLALKGGSYSLEAGLNVYLKSGFQVEKGATFYAGIDAELMTEADRGCQSGCVNPANIFTPNGDGVNDYWAFRQAFVSEYSIYVYNKWDQVIYSSLNKQIYWNGVENAWDGTGAHTSGTYKIIIETTDCNGLTNIEDPVFVYVNFGTKSTTIDDNITAINEIKENNEIIIEVYPNPATDNITINYSGNIFPIKYKLTDLNGKVIISRTITRNSELIDLRSVAAGTYIINAKAGDYNLIKKIVKR